MIESDPNRHRSRAKDGSGDLWILWHDSERVLRRESRLGVDGTRSVVLVVAPAAEHPSPTILERLAHEYGLKEELEGSWAVRPLELVRERGTMLLVLEDSGGEPLEGVLGAPMEMGAFLRLAIRMTAAVGKLHQRRLVHKDVKPANILVNHASGEVRLTGFGLASRLPRERQAPKPPEFIAGTLAYMAPEQTGRMNRSVDSRSDLYALGVTLYQMATGSLPFTATDPMEWMHCHIARKPVPPSERLEIVPAPVSAIIMRLLAKTAEDRYQTAAGLESDVRRCLAVWEAHGRIDDFPLGEHDTLDRLLIPEKLYGREREIATLLASFDRVVSSGRPELVLVSGYSGIGKSSVVRELNRVLVPPRGLFASGKFDQYKRDIPYSTLAQAFQGLVQHLLSKSEGELNEWRDALHHALGPNGQLIVNLVPGLQLIIGDPPPVPDLPLQDAQRRFQFVFRRFIGVFARPEHPLALFLDDLQWLDSATLDLIEDLLTQSDVRHLMLIGAYRDNEVELSHPLMRKLEAIRTAGAPVQEIVLAPLTREDLTQLTSDALQCGPERATSLAELIHEKAAGNPFFAIQFVSALVEEGLLTFDYGEGRWSWDLNRIRGKGYTDNVVDLMVGKLHRLPIDTREALQEMACLGHRATITTLALVHGTTAEAVHAHLWEAVRNDVIERLESAYRFIHDRVQEAAYSFIPEEGRAAAHLRIGRLLAAHTPPEEREEAIFELVNQLNRGAASITEQEERDRLAELNLIAGMRAKTSTAYASALTYLLSGAALLTEDSWERQHALAFSLEFHRAECEFLTGALAAAEERLTALSTRAATTVEQARVSCLRIDVHMTLGQSGRAIAVGLDYLRRIGMDWPPHPTDEDVRREYERIWTQIGGRTVEELIALPLMSDPVALATFDVLTRLVPPTSLANMNLEFLTVCEAVRLSLEHGHSDGSCLAYAVLGVVAGPHFGNFQAGLRFSELSYELIEQRGLRRFQALTYLVLGRAILPPTRHVRAGREMVRRAFEAASKSGDLTCAAYCCNQLNAHLLADGDPLADTQREAENGLAFAQKMRFGFIIDVISTQLALIRTLRGLTPKFGSLDDERFDELQIERRLVGNPDMALGECWYWIRKLQARYFAGDYAAAIEAASQVQRLLWTSPSPLESAEFHLYGALSHAACCDSATGDTRQQLVEALIAHHRQLEAWAENRPESFESRATLVGAEIALLEGRELDAMRLYERAIQSARANGFVHHEALAHELAGHFHLQRGFETAGSAHLGRARACYALWGADGKVRQLDELYPHLRQPEPATDARGTIGTPIEHLELTTMLNVSQAVSGELVLDKLVETLLRTAIEHAGAERGVLIELRGEELWIRAQGSTSGSPIPIVLCDVPLGSAVLPESVVRYAARAHETVNLDDASARGPFSSEEYIRREHARSVLCLPLLQQGRLMALLYLENNLAAGVFTPARMAVLNVLASQAATSLEKTRLYQELQQREAKIRRLVEANIVGVLVSHFDGRVIDANDAILNMLGYSRDDLTSGQLRWTDWTPPEWGAVNERAVAQVLAHGKCDLFEKEYLRKDGSRVPVLVAAASVEGTREYVVFVLDLTERKRAEQERERLRQLQAYLAYHNRVTTMGELAASIAHEIKQPIAAAQINAKVCVRALGDDRFNVETAREAASRMVKATTRADEIIKRTTALYKKETLQRDRVDINAMIREMAVLFQEEARASSISVQTRLIDGIPPVMADRVQLQQVFMNLILNSIEAMKETGGELTITSQMREESELLIEVSDTGVGLPADNPEHIFDSFVTTKPDGTGMGLTITRSIVESYGGRLWATANAGPGATFLFTLRSDVEEPRTSQQL